jgi:hypothetical protein
MVKLLLSGMRMSDIAEWFAEVFDRKGVFGIKRV